MPAPHFPDVFDYYPGALEFSLWAEPKANGFRLLARNDGTMDEPTWRFFSRSGVELRFPAIAAELGACRLPAGTELDGELMGVAFSVAAAGCGLDGARFFYFDMPGPGILAARHHRMETLLGRQGGRLLPLWRMGRVVRNEIEVEQAFKDFLAAGFEGAVYKSPSGAYGEGWFRRKPKLTVDAAIVGAKPGKFGPVTSLLVVVDGVQLSISAGLTKALRAELAAVGAVGRMIEFEAAERLPSGKFQSPVFRRMRPDKEPVHVG